MQKSDRVLLSGLTFKIHVSNQLVLPSDGILHPVYPNVNYRRSLFDHVGRDEVWDP